MRYFAYGANMEPGHMEQYCPGAVLLGPAVLPDHRFQIAARGYGHATAAPGHELPGVLWELSPDAADALDRFEGVPEGWYRRDTATVRRPDGSLIPVMLYLATDARAGIAVPGYLEGIIPLAERAGFPAGYVEDLRQMLPPAAADRPGSG